MLSLVELKEMTEKRKMEIPVEESKREELRLKTIEEYKLKEKKDLLERTQLKINDIELKLESAAQHGLDYLWIFDLDADHGTKLSLSRDLILQYLREKGLSVSDVELMQVNLDCSKSRSVGFGLMDGVVRNTYGCLLKW